MDEFILCELYLNDPVYISFLICFTQTEGVRGALPEIYDLELEKHASVCVLWVVCSSGDVCLVTLGCLHYL